MAVKLSSLDYVVETNTATLKPARITRKVHKLWDIYTL